MIAHVRSAPSLWARFLGLDARQPQLVAREIDNLPISNLATIAKEKKRDLLATSELPPGVGKRDDLLATSGLPPGVGKRGETAAFWKRLLHLEARDTVPAQPTPYFNQRDLKPITSSTEPATHLGLFGRGVGPETTHPPIPTVQKRDIFETVTLTIKKQ
ncbi:MAG: hypothetical protein LQ342_006042 [Letrouitia transgressa]|nr:MAG: hypothetical protein LQ342_006042 [Letrouitia transgressa]